ncbi:MAG: lycopene cyclase domain-containing protein [Intrasporangium sp.]|uniref:lycopene cyclase domain-containing protein n=1 Tax=Intrasporangium sp. TaxID=1925024 RepID=UPI003F81A6BC
MPEYTFLALAAVALTIVLERWSGTKVFATAQFWVAMAIVAGFQVLVDGWLTKLTAPIVRYASGEYLGVRWPWDVPVEDYLFGFAMVGSAIILWERAKRRLGAAHPRDDAEVDDDA